MTARDAIYARLAAFPPALRELIAAELAAGNVLEEFGAGFPAPAVGAYVKLAQPVTTRPHVSSGALAYRARCTSLHSGEWTDSQRIHFVLEPPLPPESVPSPEASLAARDAAPPSNSRAAGEAPDSRVGRFVRSMVIDYEKWHDGIGYDLSILREASPAERQAIERLLTGRGVNGWREVEALAALHTETADAVLRAAFAHGNSEICNAVLRCAPALASDAQKTAHLVEALRTAKFFEGLSQALDEVAVYHPPAIVAELFRGLRGRTDEAAVHFAAMLLFIHGRASEPFDWNQRPFFLRFCAPTLAEREAAFRELCEKIGVDPASFPPGRGNR